LCGGGLITSGTKRSGARKTCTRWHELCYYGIQTISYYRSMLRLCLPGLLFAPMSLAKSIAFAFYVAKDSIDHRRSQTVSPPSALSLSLNCEIATLHILQHTMLCFYAAELQGCRELLVAAGLCEQCLHNPHSYSTSGFVSRGCRARPSCESFLI
jgi:hypothetical protein